MKVELLAPVGTLENCHAALSAGADALYVGAPGFNARNPTKELSFPEIYTILDACRKVDKKFYFAANSLLLEKELPDIVKSLALIAELKPDALIVQDYGLVRFIRNYFPELPIHGSTLMTVHNSGGVQFLQQQGFERAVLARELTLKEIETIAKRNPEMELEIFIHGAMCFSYSGLCLFSSYLGGKSGLRGRCVQPCRRSYSIKSNSKKQGRYFFSMNDLSGLDVVADLARLGIASLKIEGRLRSAHYVQKIVQAYRLLLDALNDDTTASHDEYEEALVEAKELEKQAMGRTSSEGYFFSPQPREVVTDVQSGNIGLYLGRFTAIKNIGDKSICRLILKNSLNRGDRLRLHCEPSGDRFSFHLKTFLSAGEERDSAQIGERISFSLPENFIEAMKEKKRQGYFELYKVDSAPFPVTENIFMSLDIAAEKVTQLRKQNNAVIAKILDEIPRLRSNYFEDLSSSKKTKEAPESKRKAEYYHKKTYNRKRSTRKKITIDWWLKLDNLHLLDHRFAIAPERYIISFEKALYSRAGEIKRKLGKRSRMIMWALPPVISENEYNRIQKQIDILLASGFRSFQISHPSHVLFFTGKKAYIFGDYTLNIMNSEAVQEYKRLGLSGALAAIELDKEKLQQLCIAVREFPVNERLPIGVCAYGAPPLYTARLTGPFPLEKEILSPREESYTIYKKDGYTITRPIRPFSLLDYHDELQEMGVNYLLIDSCGHSRKKDIAELDERLLGSGRYGKLATFNYLGNLQ